MGCLQMGHFEIPHLACSKHQIKFIHEKITLTHCVENEFNPISDVHNIENRVLQIASFANASFAKGRFLNSTVEIYFRDSAHLSLSLMSMLPNLISQNES